MFTRLRSYFQAMRQRAKFEREMDDEVREHIEARAADLIGTGLTRAQALRKARIEFGGIESYQDECRESRQLHLVENTVQDVRGGLRLLRKSPGFTALAVLTLAIGIGANTAIFSIVDWIVLRPLSFNHPEQVSSLSYRQKGHYGNGFSYPNYDDIRDQTAGVFSDVASYDLGQDGLTVDGKTAPIFTAYVSGNFFRLTGINPFLGRFLLPQEGKVTGADPVIVISYNVWRNRFASDPSVIGKHVSVNGRDVIVVGVAPKDFRTIFAALETEAFLPMAMVTLEPNRAPDMMTNRQAEGGLIIARLRDGVSLAQAQAVLNVVSTRLVQAAPDVNDGVHVYVTHLGPQGPASNSSQNPIKTFAAIFLSLAFLVLVLACLNVANMLLVRGAARQREMAVRAALGAARGRLVRQLLVESMLLAVLGCLGGILLGAWASYAMGSINLRSSIPIFLDFHFDWRVFTYAFAMALATGFLAGIVPALRASRANVSEMLHQGDRAASGGRQRLRSALVAAQVAGSLVLLVIAGLFIRSLGNVRFSDLGFEGQHVLNLTMDPHEIGYSEVQGREFYRQLLERVQALPGIGSASIAATVPMGEIQLGDPIAVEGRPAESGQTKPSAGYNFVSPAYFDVMHIPLLRGRKFSDRDEQNSERVAIINESMAQTYWPNVDAIGRHFSLLEDPKHLIEIVGVVKNSKTGSIAEAPSPYYYAPIAQHYTPLTTLQVRALASPESITQETIQTIESLAPTMPVYNVQSMSGSLRGLNGFLLYEIGAGLTAGLGILGLVLATTGVYGVVSYAAAQRTREIGIRMALGARPAQVLNMVCRQGFTLIGMGVLVGLAAALALGRAVRSFLIGIGPNDPLTFVAVSAILLAIGVAACYVPALRAAKVDPVIALRHE
ncbi:MAG TPA: ABC transporter permease [Candidatus Acidoferrales bacterium]|nr:ABC transporter permease [Candidatus Acidoferrales bacterium]